MDVTARGRQTSYVLIIALPVDGENGLYVTEPLFTKIPTNLTSGARITATKITTAITNAKNSNPITIQILQLQ